MNVLVGNHIEFEEDGLGNPYATIYGDYKIIEMPDSEFEEWEEDTCEDYLTSEYKGAVWLCKRVELNELLGE